MRCLIVAAAVAVGLVSSAANAQSADADVPIIYCRDVKMAMHLHQMASAGGEVMRYEAEKALDNGSCNTYKGAEKWKVVSINQTAGYAKIAYDIHTKNQKIGFIPYFYIWSMGLDQ